MSLEKLQTSLKEKKEKILALINNNAQAVTEISNKYAVWERKVKEFLSLEPEPSTDKLKNHKNTFNKLIEEATGLEALINIAIEDAAKKAMKAAEKTARKEEKKPSFFSGVIGSIKRTRSNSMPLTSTGNTSPTTQHSAPTVKQKSEVVEKENNSLFVLKKLEDFEILFKNDTHTANKLVRKLAIENASWGLKTLNSIKINIDKTTATKNPLNKTSLIDNDVDVITSALINDNNFTDTELLAVINKLFQLEDQKNFGDADNLLSELIKQLDGRKCCSAFKDLINTSLDTFNNNAAARKARMDYTQSMAIMKEGDEDKDKNESKRNTANYKISTGFGLVDLPKQNNNTSQKPICNTQENWGAMPSIDAFNKSSSGTTMQLANVSNHNGLSKSAHSAHTNGVVPTSNVSHTSNQNNNVLRLEAAINKNDLAQKTTLPESFATMVKAIFSADTIPTFVLQLLKSAKTYLADKDEDTTYRLLANMVYSIAIKHMKSKHTQNADEILSKMPTLIASIIAPLLQLDNLSEMKRILYANNGPTWRKNFREAITKKIDAVEAIPMPSLNTNQGTKFDDLVIVEKINEMLKEIHAPTQTSENKVPENKVVVTKHEVTEKLEKKFNNTQPPLQERSTYQSLSFSEKFPSKTRPTRSATIGGSPKAGSLAFLGKDVVKGAKKIQRTVSSQDGDTKNNLLPSQYK